MLARDDEHGCCKENASVDFKKHIFVIIVAAVVILAIGGYCLIVPSITEEADKARKACEDKANSIADSAAKAGKPDGLKTPKHMELASKYDEKVQKQIAEIQKIWADKNRLHDHSDKAPKDSSFDMWLGDLRKEITELADKAGLKLPDDADARMFREPATNDQAKDETLRRDYRIRHMAIIQEVVDILSKKPVKQEVEGFDPEKPVVKKQVDVGALALEKINIAAKPRLPSEKSTAWEEILKRANRSTTPPAGTPPPAKFTELPYTILTVDLIFVAPLASVPAYMKALETSSRWMAVVSRVDFQRLPSVPPFPPAGDKRLETAGPVPGVNTYYQEAPVRVQVTLDLYENDKSREDEFIKSLAAAPVQAAAAPAAK
jgi:hypothetical protein